jgi:hypothetical protein
MEQGTLDPIKPITWSVKEPKAPRGKTVPREKTKFKSRKERRSRYLNRKAKKKLRRLRRKRKNKKEKLILTPTKRTHFLVLEAPKNFSFIHNTEEVLQYFKEATKFISKRKQVKFDMQKVDSFTPDAIAMLIAKIKDVNFTRGLMIQGNGPKKPELKKLFDESGFLEHVNSAYIPPTNPKNRLIHQVTRKKVFPDIAKDIGVTAVEHTFKDNRKFQPIFKIMIECMANTDNHANPNKEGVYNWWLFAYCNPDNNATCFTFLDLGVGIFNSLSVTSWKRNLLTKLENLTTVSLTAGENVNLVPSLFSGEIYTSKTKDKKRGQGLPSIKELSENPHIKNFVVITNNTKISLPTLTTESLKNKFNGTMLYWELHP